MLYSLQLLSASLVIFTTLAGVIVEPCLSTANVLFCLKTCMVERLIDSKDEMKCLVVFFFFQVLVCVCLFCYMQNILEASQIALDLAKLVYESGNTL